MVGYWYTNRQVKGMKQSKTEWLSHSHRVNWCAWQKHQDYCVEIKLFFNGTKPPCGKKRWMSTHIAYHTQKIIWEWCQQDGRIKSSSPHSPYRPKCVYENSRKEWSCSTPGKCKAKNSHTEIEKKSHHFTNNTPSPKAGTVSAGLMATPLEGVGVEKSGTCVQDSSFTESFPRHWFLYFLNQNSLWTRTVWMTEGCWNKGERQWWLAGEPTGLVVQ